MNIIDIDTKYVAGTYKRFPVEIVSGKGSVVKDRMGKEYIDMGAGIAVTGFGIADEQWKRAVTDQISKGTAYVKSVLYRALRKACGNALSKNRNEKSVFFQFRSGGQ